MFQLRVAAFYGLADAGGDILQQVGRPGHLGGDDVVYPGIIGGIFERIAVGGRLHVIDRGQIHDEIVSVALFLFQAAVEGPEAHSAQFQQSFFHIFLSIFGRRELAQVHQFP